MKPVVELTKLERLKEVVALQRMRAKEGMQGSNRTDLTLLRDRSATGPLLYSFKGDWDALIAYYLADAEARYEHLKKVWSGEGSAFQQLVRENGLQNVVNYRLERRKQ